MTPQEKRRFVREFIGRVRDEVLEVLPKTPEQWDGFELRWLIAEHFSKAIMAPLGGGQRRRREYNNEVITRNLA